MRTFNYSKISENKWDSELLGLIAAIYKEAGKQELYFCYEWTNRKSQRCPAD